MSADLLGPGRSVDAVVVAAMADEAAPFRQRADWVSEPERGPGSVQQRLVVAGLDVLLVQSGIGQVSAATAATVALSSVVTPLLVSAGSAGGLGARVRVGDVVVGTSHAYTGADARASGYALGQVPGMPPVYAAEPALLHLVGCAAPAGLRVHRGPVVSGDCVIDASSVRALRQSFPGALSSDMESTALAQTAHLFGVPFLSVRGISNLCGPVAGADLLPHVDDAANRSARVVLAVLAALVPAPR